MDENKNSVDTNYSTNSSQPVKTKKPIYKKWWFWLIIVIVLLGFLGLFGGNDEEGNVQTDNTTSNKSINAQEPTKNPNSIGNYECQVLKATLCKDYAGKDAVKITYNFTNNADEPASFDIALIDEVYQNGVQLETAILGIDDDVDYGLDAKIKKGVSKEVTKVYTLRDNKTPLDIEISEFISLSDDKLTTTVEFQ